MTRFTRRLFLAAALLTLGITVQQHYRVTLKLQDPLGGHINDFDRWMLMTPAFVQDHADYVNDRLPTPPLTLLILAPFTSLSRPAAQFVWVCMKLPLAATWLALAVVRRCGVRLTVAATTVLAGWWLPARHAEGATNFVALLPLMAGHTRRTRPLGRRDRRPARRSGDRRQNDAGDLRYSVEAVDRRGVAVAGVAI